MPPDSEARDALFKAFGRAFLRQDLDAMYEVVTPGFTWTVLDDGVVRNLASREAIARFFEERRGRYEGVRFEDVVFHHAPEATSMTYRMTGTVAATGEAFERVGVKRHSFEDGRLAVKDVHGRPVP